MDKSEGSLLSQEQIATTESAGVQPSIEQKKRQFSESFSPVEGLSAGQRSRRRWNRRLLRTQDEPCRVRMETDEILEAKESEDREIRDHCKDKIEKHKSELEKIVSIKKSRSLSLHRRIWS